MSEGQWYRPCCSRERTEAGVLPTSSQKRGTAGEEGGAGPVGQGSREGGSELGEVLTGALEVQVRYAYTGKRSERSLYIAERAQSIHSLTRSGVLQMYYKDQNGACVPYQERNLRYDFAKGYLRQEGGSQVGKGGAMHRGRWGLARGGGVRLR